MRQALEASRLWKVPLMLWKVEQNRDLVRMRQAWRQASRLWKLPWMR